MTGQACCSAPVNKCQVVLQGTEVMKSNSEEQLGKEVVSKFGLAFLLPAGKELTPRSGHGVNSTHGVWACQHCCTGHKPEWFMKTASIWLMEHSESKMTTGLQDLGSSRAELPTQESSQAGEGGRPRGPPNHTMLYRCSVYNLGTQPIFGWLHGKDKRQEKGIDDLWGSNHQLWHTEETADHLPPWCWAREAQYKTIDIPKWFPWDPEIIWAGTETRGKAGEENSTLQTWKLKKSKKMEKKKGRHWDKVRFRAQQHCTRRHTFPVTGTKPHGQ